MSDYSVRHSAFALERIYAASRAADGERQDVPGLGIVRLGDHRQRLACRTPGASS